MQMKSPIKSLYYITHIDNVPSIIEHGILSHALVEARQVSYTPIYDSEIVSNRKSKQTPDGKSLWEFANLYLQPRNPMMYRVVHEKNKDDVAVIAIRAGVLELEGIYITSGNAASASTLILPKDEGLKVISEMWKIIDSEWWRADDGSKRKIVAECLVPDFVPPFLIDSVYVTKHSTAEGLRLKVAGFANTPEIIPESNMFFQPTLNKRVTENINLIQGDMFFSQMQTLTISVNTVGIMGKGLASRAKYQFPDVYVVYQDACRSKKLKKGRPFLYKREAPMDSELADESVPLNNLNSKKWFLLFPTKRHWREDSLIEDIEEGLVWLSKHYKSEGIQSLAIPALGCGLGGLRWSLVGPLMCKYLVNFDIPVSIYLPREHEVTRDELEPGFLLGQI